jgi:hypothetical protein
VSKCHWKWLEKQAKSFDKLADEARKLAKGYSTDVDNSIDTKKAYLILSRIPRWLKQTESDPDRDKSIYTLYPLRIKKFFDALTRDINSQKAQHDEAKEMEKFLQHEIGEPEEIPRDGHHNHGGGCPRHNSKPGTGSPFSGRDRAV